MKKLRITLLMIIAAVMLLPACKKGADDPFLSLRSRKARLDGKWTLNSGTLTKKENGVTTTYTYTSSLKTVTSNGSNPVSTPYSQTMTFKSDHTFESDINDDGAITTTTGGWYFGRRNKDVDLKNKESVVLFVTKSVNTVSGISTTDTYSGEECPSSVIILDELKHSELKVDYDGQYQDIVSSSTTTEVMSGTLVYEK